MRGFLVDIYFGNDRISFCVYMCVCVGIRVCGLVGERFLASNVRLQERQQAKGRNRNDKKTRVSRLGIYFTLPNQEAGTGNPATKTRDNKEDTKGRGGSGG